MIINKTMGKTLKNILLTTTVLGTIILNSTCSKKEPITPKRNYDSKLIQKYGEPMLDELVQIYGEPILESLDEIMLKKEPNYLKK